MKKLATIVIAIVCIITTFGITYIFVGAIKDQEIKEQSNKLSDLEYWQYGFGLNPPGNYSFNKHKFPRVGIVEPYEYWYVNDSITDFTGLTGRMAVFVLDDLSGNSTNVSLSVYRPKFITDERYVPRYIFDNRSLDAYASEEMRVFYSFFSNVTYISNTTKTINGMDAYESVFIGAWGTNQMKIKKVFVEKNGGFFEIIYTAPLSAYDKYIEDVNQSINSFRIQ